MNIQTARGDEVDPRSVRRADPQDASIHPISTGSPCASSR